MRRIVRAEVLVLHELGELDPGVDLLGRRVVGQHRCGRPQPGGEAGLDVEAGEGLVEEVGDDPPALLVGQLGESVHGLHLLWVASSAGDRLQHRRLDAQDADLRLQRRGVRGGHVGHRELVLEHATDRREVDPEVAQRPHQPEPGRRVGPVPPVAGARCARPAARGRRRSRSGSSAPAAPWRRPVRRCSAGRSRTHDRVSTRWRVKRAEPEAGGAARLTTPGPRDINPGGG